MSELETGTKHREYEIHTLVNWIIIETYLPNAVAKKSYNITSVLNSKKSEKEDKNKPTEDQNNYLPTINEHHRVKPSR